MRIFIFIKKILANLFQVQGLVTMFKKVALVWKVFQVVTWVLGALFGLRGPATSKERKDESPLGHDDTHT